MYIVYSIDMTRTTERERRKGEGERKKEREKEGERERGRGRGRARVDSFQSTCKYFVKWFSCCAEVSHPLAAPPTPTPFAELSFLPARARFDWFRGFWVLSLVKSLDFIAFVFA